MIITPESRVLLEEIIIFQLVRNSQYFVEPESSLSYSQQNAQQTLET
jgi:hypothetical protein